MKIAPFCDIIIDSLVEVGVDNDRSSRDSDEDYCICTDEILAGFGKMHIADEWFKKNIDKYGEGAVEFVSDAISNGSNYNMMEMSYE